MLIVNYPVLFPSCFLIVALIWSVVQAYAGFQYGLYICDTARKDLETAPHVRLVAYGLYRGAFYFICTLSGFAAWSLAQWVSERIVEWSKVAVGSGSIIVALTVLSTLGVSGILPRMLFLGKRPV